MARPQESDYLQNFRFHARIEAFEESNVNFFLFDPGDVGVSSEAGFQSISIPEVTFEATEYREGTFKYTKKFVGVPTWGESTFMRGVTAGDTGFAQWSIAAHGGGAYRADIRVEHYHREDVGENVGEDIPTTAPTRVYTFKEAIPTRMKLSADMESTSGEVSLAEMDVSVEYVELLPEAPNAK